MDTKTLLAAAPFARRAWRWMPGPLRVPLLAFALIVWVYRKVTGDEPEPATESAPGSPPT